jgi:hypothetical protein
MFGPAAETACALSANLAAWGFNCGQLSQTLRDHYGFSTEDTRFLDGFAALPSFEEATLRIIQDDLDRGVPPRQIVLAARLIHAYEQMFWDPVAAAAVKSKAPDLSDAGRRGGLGLAPYTSRVRAPRARIAQRTHFVATYQLFWMSWASRCVATRRSPAFSRYSRVLTSPHMAPRPSPPCARETVMQCMHEIV